MSNIDLDIKNYTQKDIEKFFKLKGNYTLNDVEYKSYEIQFSEPTKLGTEDEFLKVHQRKFG